MMLVLQSIKSEIGPENQIFYFDNWKVATREICGTNEGAQGLNEGDLLKVEGDQGLNEGDLWYK